MRDVQHQRPRGFGHIDGALPCQTKANVILGKQNALDALPVLRLVLANPKQFGKREICQRRIRSEFDQSGGADFVGQLAALFVGPLIAPDNGRTNDCALGVEQNRAVHLPGKTDAGDLIAGNIRSPNGILNGELAGFPPVSRILLGPSGLRRGERDMLARRWPNTLPDTSMMTALVPPVPTSIPRNICECTVILG